MIDLLSEGPPPYQAPSLAALGAGAAWGERGAGLGGDLPARSVPLPTPGGRAAAAAALCTYLRHPARSRTAPRAQASPRPLLALRGSPEHRGNVSMAFIGQSAPDIRNVAKKKKKCK